MIKSLRWSYIPHYKDWSVGIRSLTLVYQSLVSDRCWFYSISDPALLSQRNLWPCCKHPSPLSSKSVDKIGWLCRLDQEFIANVASLISSSWGRRMKRWFITSVTDAVIYRSDSSIVSGFVVVNNYWKYSEATTTISSSILTHWCIEFFSRVILLRARRCFVFV